jgi:hypothetical protein
MGGVHARKRDLVLPLRRRYVVIGRRFAHWVAGSYGIPKRTCAHLIVAIAEGRDAR